MLRIFIDDNEKGEDFVDDREADEAFEDYCEEGHEVKMYEVFPGPVLILVREC